MPAAPMPITARLRRGVRDAMPSGHAWWFVLGALVIGLLLFLVLWLSRAPARIDDSEQTMQRPGGGHPSTALPAPLPAAANADRGIDYARTQDQAAPVRIDAHVPQRAPPTTAAPIDAPPVMQDAPVRMAATDLPTSVPRPLATPAPDYPRASIRRGERGDVTVLVQVDADGRVSDVELVSSSQHRRLDRAAMAAARRWRFEPAMRDGQPVPGELRIPFSFAPAGG